MLVNRLILYFGYRTSSCRGGRQCMFFRYHCHQLLLLLRYSLVYFQAFVATYIIIRQSLFIFSGHHSSIIWQVISGWIFIAQFSIKDFSNAQQYISTINQLIYQQLGDIIQKMSDNYLPLIEPQLQFKPSRQQSVLSNYDPSAYPANLQFARNHGQAQKIGQYIPPKQDIQRCPCCLQAIHKATLPLTCQHRQLLHLGCAYPLYLYFIKQCIMLLIINILLCSIPQLVINIRQGSMCVVLDGLVYSFYGLICKSSVINIMNVTEIDMLEVSAVINFCVIFVNIAVVAVIDLFMTRRYNQYYEDYHILPKASDYSVVVKGLPKDITITEIYEFVDQRMRETGCSDTTIHKIYLIYNLKTYYSLYSNKRASLQQMLQIQKKRQVLQQKLQKLDGNQPLSERTRLTREKKEATEKLNELQNKKQLIQIEINQYEEMFQLLVNRITSQQPIDPNTHNNQMRAQNKNSPNLISNSLQDEKQSNLKLSFSGKCIITLNSKQSKDRLTQQTKNMYFLQKLGYQIGQFLGGSSSSIMISDAPEPSEIIFSNIGSQKKTQWRDSTITTLSLTFLIVLDLVLLTLLKKLIKQEKAIDSSNIILSFINSQIIAIFNSLVSRVIRMAENKTQMHSTQSSYYYSITWKLILLNLVNMLVTTFFSNLVNYYLLNKKTTQSSFVFPLNFQEYLFDVFFLLITNPFVSFFLIYFDHRQAYKLYKRYQIQKQNIPVTQAQANLYYENMQIDISNKYSNVYRFMLFSAGICFIYPPALIVCLFTLTVFYWEDKYLFLNRYVVVHKLNFYLTTKLQKFLWAFPLMMAITNLIIMFVPIKDGKAFEEGKYSKAFYYLAISALITTGAVFLGGCKWVTLGIQKVFFLKKSSKVQKMPEYKDIESDFEDDYWHYYPYFKVQSKQKIMSMEREKEGKNVSPRKSKIDSLNKKMGMDVFSVIKNHLHHERYAPIS